uniref:Uncharacterized protein n=1 Tax=Opuntia streptacantha TaxID=393608 RepID=A0A7C9ER10_OPUST
MYYKWKKGRMPKMHPTKDYVQSICKLSTRSATSKTDPQKSPLSQKKRVFKTRSFKLSKDNSTLSKTLRFRSLQMLQKNKMWENQSLLEFYFPTKVTFSSHKIVANRIM